MSFGEAFRGDAATVIAISENVGRVTAKFNDGDGTSSGNTCVCTLGAEDNDGIDGGHACVLMAL